MVTKPNENTFSERKQKFELICDKLGPQNPRSKENAERLLEYVQSGALPFSSSYTPQEAFDKNKLHRDYFLQLFFSVGEEIIADDLSKSEVEEKLEEEENKSMPSGLPSDGSKGQWKTAKRHRCKAYRWFLCQWDGDQFE